MKLAVIYLKPFDDDSDTARTELFIHDEHSGGLIAHEDSLQRSRLRHELGAPLYSAEAETPDYRDVDVWEIEAKRGAGT